MLPLLATTLLLAVSQVSSQYPPELFSPLIQTKIQGTAETLDPSRYVYPQHTDRVQGEWQFFPPDTWTSGFFPATLYAMNQRDQLCGSSSNQKVDWLNLGRGWSTGEIPLEAQTSVGHDVGFLSFPFVDELEINPKNETALTAVNAFASALAARYSPVVRCTRSWGNVNDPVFQVIIDNMMNLEVLFVSAGLTGNNTLRDIAVAHADTTMKNHIRADGSSFQVVEYNLTTGDVMAKRTQQGYSNDSTWSRGQAWGIYGFANVYNHTKDQKYIEAARQMATYFLQHIPADGIIPWDFDAPLTPLRPADSSAATIAAMALIFLSRLDVDNAQMWRDAALNILSNTIKLAWRPSWQSLLSNGTVDNSSGNNLTGTVYGDYYFIKAGNELASMGLVQC